MSVVWSKRRDTTAPTTLCHWHSCRLCTVTWPGHHVRSLFPGPAAKRKRREETKRKARRVARERPPTQ